MNSDVNGGGHQLGRLPFPLRNLGIDLVMDPNEVFGEGKTFGEGLTKTRQAAHQQELQCSFLDFGSVSILVGKATPHDSWEEDSGRSSLTLCYTGVHQFTDGRSRYEISPGSLFLNPRNGGRMRLSPIASINLPVEHKRLERTMRAMRCSELGVDLSQPWLLGGEANRGRSASSVLAFFSFVDQLLLDGRDGLACLGLDDQLYRLLVQALVYAAGRHETAESRWSFAAANWHASLDELVDFIRSSAHLNLILTDLEAFTSYSARSLQKQFREKLDCTPMQFVRRQKLGYALERLQQAGDGESVTAVARACGYRHVSNFSLDFKREFAVTPSQVLRRSRAE